MNKHNTATRLITVALIFLIAFSFQVVQAQGSYVTFTSNASGFSLSSFGKVAPIHVDEHDFAGVLRAAKSLQQDILGVSELLPVLSTSAPSDNHVVLIGTIGKNKWIDELIRSKKLDVAEISGHWESSVIQTVDQPFPGVQKALVIAGSDKRGTIFGIYDLSRKIGVSPWHWWADVPVKKNKTICIQPGRYVSGEPSVKYRGIFINDEEPALGRWVVEKYGGFNHEFYEKVFELILRHKGNYLWPAMWWASFSSNDPLNPKLADEYGIVIGTTHHEPMMRAHAEWKKVGGEWNYETNATQLQKFWTEGIQRMSGYESIISLGMRGDGDKAMTEETNIALLQKIVADQRSIIRKETGKALTDVPQLWALYKEVQDYYDKGMTVPDDITLLLCDDNWGNIRKLPKKNEKPRTGGYGIYYHFDYVGGPRNYKWMNTNPLPRVWEQMHLAHEYGADRIWIVNVGDIKPLELPTSFFLDYAWDVKRWNENNVNDYLVQWAGEQFGVENAKEIGEILSLYAFYNGRRKPELLSANTYSITNYGEAETVVKDYNVLTEKAEALYKKIDKRYQDAFFQLVLYPVKASATLHELWVTVGKNRLYAAQGRASANDLADKAAALFEKDRELSRYYNKTLAAGKWNNMANQTHISYTYWQQPEKDVLPEVKKLDIPTKSLMGLAVEGSDDTWPRGGSAAALSAFENYSHASHYFDIFNQGTIPFSYAIKTDQKWLTIDTIAGTIEKEKRINVSVDWKAVPSGTQRASISISTQDQKTIVINVIAKNIQRTVPGIHYESDGYISIEAAHFTKAFNNATHLWKVLPGIGRTLSGVTTFPVTASSDSLGNNSARLEYVLNTEKTGEVSVHVYTSPTLNFHNTQGLRFAISFDNEPAQIVNLHEDKSTPAWDTWVADNIIVKSSRHTLQHPGNHILKLWCIDPGVVIQKIVIDTGGLKPSYLGPPETYFQKTN